MMSAACPVCLAPALPRPYYSTNEWVVRRCSACTYAWVVDLEHPPESSAFGWNENIVAESEKRFPMYRNRLARIERFEPAPQTWLDVGCGGGGMLRVAAEAGYAVEGVELSPSAATVSSQLGIPVHNRTLEESRGTLRSHAYGVISYFHVLEHVQHPAAELRTARELLGEKGVLAVEVPFFDTLSWKLLGPMHRHLYRGHRSYFNVKSLSELLRRAGYTVLRWEKVPYMMSIGWLLMRMRQDWLASVLPEAIARAGIRIDLGDVLLMIARRNSGALARTSDSRGAG